MDVDATGKSTSLAFAGGIIAIVLGWVLNSLVSSMQLQRGFTQDLLDRVSVMEIRVERLEAVQSRVERNVFKGDNSDGG